MKKEITKLANHLDRIGHPDLADRLDMILKSANDYAPDPPRQEAEKAEEEEAETEKEVKEEDEAADGEVSSFSTVASSKIDAMAKLISKEFSLTSSGNVHRG